MRLPPGLKHTARNTAQRSHSDKATAEGQSELSPFDRLAAKMGLPANRDIDLRKQDDLEVDSRPSWMILCALLETRAGSLPLNLVLVQEQMTGSVSSLEGLSPSGESYHHDPRGGVGSVGKRAYDEDIPWRLIPITGECCLPRSFKTTLCNDETYFSLRLWNHMTSQSIYYCIAAGLKNAVRMK